MPTRFLLVLLLCAAALSALISCGRSVGRGAAAGAIGGAVVGGPIGAAIGAVGGAIVGGAVGERDAARYGAPPEQGYPLARPTDTPGMVLSPYTTSFTMSAKCQAAVWCSIAKSISSSVGRKHRARAQSHALTSERKAG
jgi:hypothetical protein